MQTESTSDPGPAASSDSGVPSNTNVFSVARGSGFLAAGDLFDYVSRAVAALILARALGAHEYGIYNIAVSTAFVFAGVADFGLMAAMERFIAVFRKRDDHGGVRGTVQLGVRITALGALGAGLAMLLLSPTLAFDVFDDPGLLSLFRIFSVIVPVMALTNILTAIVRGYKRMDHSAFAFDFVQPITRLVLIVIFAFLALNPTIATIIFGVSYLAALIAIVQLTRRDIRAYTPAAEPRREPKNVMRFALPFWLVSLMTKIRSNLQSILLGALNTATSVGVFSVAGSANLVGRIANLSIATSIRPVMAELFDSDETEEMAQLYKTTTRWTLTLNLPILVVMVVYAGPILALFGETFVLGSSALIILAASETVNAITGTCGAIVDMSGRGVMKVVNKVAAIGFFIVTNLLLIPPFGVIGAAYAVLVTNVAIQVTRVIEVRWFAGMHPYDMRILRPIVAGALTFSAGWGLVTLTGSDLSFIGLVLSCLAVAGFYLFVLVLLRLPDEERLILLRLRSRIRWPRRNNDGR